MVRLLSSAVALACGLALLSLAADPALADPRVALVIGNSAYQNAPRLDNPVNDAAAIAEMFKSIGFDVIDSRRDLGNLEFKRALREFEDKADKADIAVVYYAGHGMEVGGRNYLIPVDARLESDFDALDEAVDLDRVFVSLEAAHVRLVILDACRDNPFVKRMKHRYAVRSGPPGAGLGAIEFLETGTLVAYAAKAGSIAEDNGDGHTPYAKALLKYLPESGLDIRIALGKVRDDVVRNTATHQEPVYYGSLGGAPISLAPAKP
jgi:uncharacterized caspase-like protein